jgi:hypothetical protein
MVYKPANPEVIEVQKIEEVLAPSIYITRIIITKPVNGIPTLYVEYMQGSGEDEEFEPFTSKLAQITVETLQSLMAANPTMYDAIKQMCYQALITDEYIPIDGEML